MPKKRDDSTSPSDSPPSSSSSGNSQIEKERIKLLNYVPVHAKGKYVLYWVQASPRIALNHALEYAVERANQHNAPLLACFGLTEGGEFNPMANIRHFSFMLEGVSQLQRELRKRNINLLISKGGPVNLATELAKAAIEVVVDRGYLRIQREWYDAVSKAVSCQMTQVETNVVVPVELATDKEEYAARTIRPRIWKHAKRFLKPLEEVHLLKSSLDLELQDDLDIEPLDISDEEGLEEVLEHLKVNQDVPRVKEILGGHEHALETLNTFIKQKLMRYDELRNNPINDYLSGLSPYLHFGQISPVEIILAVSKSGANTKSKDSFIEELMIRRELSMNFIWYNPDKYDTLQAVPDWAQKTMRDHLKDKREYIYSLEDFEAGQTHDRYWNACQLEMVHKGKMHGYMRMYWGKKVIEWTPDYETAYRYLVLLNDKYELDGRDPNGYTGIAWCFGKHDQGWTERAIFGKLRYMNSDGLKRKMKNGIDIYAANCYKLAGRKLGDERNFKGEAPPIKKKKKESTD